MTPQTPSAPRRPPLRALAAAIWRGTPLRDCLRSSAEELSACADEAAAILAGLALPEVAEAERALLPGEGYDLQALLAQGHAAALSGRPDIQQACGVTPQMLEAARAVQSEMLRAQAGAAQLREDAEDGERFLQAMQAHGCTEVLSWIAQELERATPVERQKLHGLAAPLLGLWERSRAQRAQQAAREERRLRPLAERLEQAQAERRTGETLAAVARGEQPEDEAILEAAERLGGPGRRTPGETRR
ncbi:MAG: hypothetical protein RMK29_19525 [Myxococcales bacterium]|nr:hypothetical protein [Myxococcota bacterium]MDW8283898.1 hypothetical protein [Myxococcales bacterium]